MPKSAPPPARPLRTAEARALEQGVKAYAEKRYAQRTAALKKQAKVAGAIGTAGILGFIGYKLLSRPK